MPSRSSASANASCSSSTSRYSSNAFSRYCRSFITTERLKNTPRCHVTPQVTEQYTFSSSTARRQITKRLAIDPASLLSMRRGVTIICSSAGTTAVLRTSSLRRGRSNIGGGDCLVARRRIPLDLRIPPRTTPINNTCCMGVGRRDAGDSLCRQRPSPRGFALFLRRHSADRPTDSAR